MLQKSTDAKNKTTEAEGLERIQLAVMASHDDRGINTTSLAKNLSQINGLTDLDNKEITEDTSITLPKRIKLNNKKYKIKEDGKVIIINSIYQEIEYIESNGQQYIDTGKKLSIDFDKIVAEFQYTDLSKNWQTVYGTQESSNNFLLRAKFNNMIFYSQGANDINVDTLNISTKYKSELVYENNTNTLYWNGINKGTAIYNGNFNYSIYLFTSNIKNRPSIYNIDQYCYLKLYSFKLYKENELIADFKPCIRELDEVVGLYDIVEGKFYANANTSEGAVDFTAGPDV